MPSFGKKQLKRLLREPAVMLGIAVVVAGIFFLLVMRMMNSGSSESSLTSVLNRGTLKVGILNDFEPFGYLDEKNAYTGFEVELGEWVAAELVEGGFAEYKVVQQKTKESYLNYGYVDVLIARADTASDEYLSSTAYYHDPVVLMAMEKIEFENSEDLVLGTVLNSSSERVLNAYLKRTGTNLVQVVSYPSFPDVIEALQKKEISAVCYEESALLAVKQDTMRFITPQVGTVMYGIAVPQGDHALLSAVQKAFLAIKEDGRLASLYKKYNLTEP